MSADEVERLRQRERELEAEVARLRARERGDGVPGATAAEAPAGRDELLCAVEKARLPMILIDPNQPDDPIVFANRAFQELSGYGTAELLGRNCRFLQGPETDPAQVAAIRDAIAARRDVAVEILNYRRDGTPFVNELSISPVFDQDGSLLDHFGSQLDVTGSRRDRRQLEATEARQRAILDSAVDFGILVTDRDGRVIDWNVGAERVFGWSAAEMLGDTVERVFTPEDRAIGRAATEMRLSLSDERWHLPRDGSRFFATGEMMPLRGADEAHLGFLKIVRDRTAEHLAGRALEEAEARLRRAQEAGGVGLFTIDVADDVRHADGGVLPPVRPAGPRQLPDGRLRGADPARGRGSGLRPGRPVGGRVAGRRGIPHPPRRHGRAALDRAHGGVRARRRGARRALPGRRARRDRAARRGRGAGAQRGALSRPVRGHRRRLLHHRVLRRSARAAERLRPRRGQPRLRAAHGHRRHRRQDAARDRTRRGGRLGRALRRGAADGRVDPLRARLRGGGARHRGVGRPRGAREPAAGVAAVPRHHRAEAGRGRAAQERGPDARACRAGAARAGRRRHRGNLGVGPAGRPRHGGRGLRPHLRARPGARPRRTRPGRGDPDGAPGRRGRARRRHRRRARGGAYAHQYRARHADGVYRWIEAHGRVEPGPDGAPLRFPGVLMDIEDRRAVEAERDRAAAELRALNETLEQRVAERTAELMRAEELLRQSQKMEAVGQLTGGIAHDLNNLLTGIMGSLDLLAKRVAQGRLNELDRYLVAANGAAKRAAALTHRLLAFSRRQTLDPRPTDSPG